MLRWPRLLLSATPTLARRRGAWHCGTPGGLRVARLAFRPRCHVLRAQHHGAHVSRLARSLGPPAACHSCHFFGPFLQQLPPPRAPRRLLIHGRVRTGYGIVSVPGEEGHGSDTRSPARRFSRAPTLLPCAPLPRHPPPPASLPLAEPHPSKPARAVQRALERPSSASRAPPSASPATLQHARHVCVCVCVCCAPRWSCPSCPPLLPRS